MTEHLRLSGLYWGLTSLHLLGFPSALNSSLIIQFVLSCQDSLTGESSKKLFESAVMGFDWIKSRQGFGERLES